MSQPLQPLIAGAGPVGLAAALFLARDGVRARIIDSADAPAVFSKALAVNPRTLEILDPCGITAEMLKIGKPIHGGRFWQENKPVADVDFAGLDHRFPFLLALSQGVTVRLLEQALNRAGIEVERGVRLAHCRNVDEHVEAELESTGGGSETVRCPWLLAADGAHSVARHELGVKFEGSSFKRPWYLLDIPLETKLSPDRAHIIFLDGGGFYFLLPVIDDAPPAGAPVWRVLGDFPNLLDRLDALGAKATGPAVWNSSFHISHRINEHMQVGRVFFAGDSAHIHSPVVARGMNLGIEDAWVLSQLVKKGRLSSYDELRHDVDRRVVRRIALLSRTARGESVTSRILRRTALPFFARNPLTKNTIRAMVTGLDHPLPII